MIHCGHQPLLTSPVLPHPQTQLHLLYSQPSHIYIVLYVLPFHLHPPSSVALPPSSILHSSVLYHYQPPPSPPILVSTAHKHTPRHSRQSPSRPRLTPTGQFSLRLALGRSFAQFPFLSSPTGYTIPLIILDLARRFLPSPPLPIPLSSYRDEVTTSPVDLHTSPRRENCNDEDWLLACS